MDELKAKIIACMDELTFLDLLGLDIADLVEKYEDEIEQERERFERATN